MGLRVDLSGRTALVTGGARRIGRAVALALADCGANVVVSYLRSGAQAGDLVGEIRARGVEAWAIRADLSDPGDLETLVDRVVEAAGPFDILINNASAFPENTFEEVTLEDLVAGIKTDAWAPFELGREFARVCRSGHIVNLLDTRVTDYDWRHVSYHAAKSLLWLFTRMMAVRLAPAVAVNAVAPGLILPPPGRDETYLESMARDLPLQRAGCPQDVADAVLYLVSSSFVTGQVIFVDGGRHVRGSVCG